MVPFITSKLPETGATIFTVMSALAQKYNAVNLGQGFPDFPVDPRLINLVNKAMEDGHNQYVHMNGLLALRKRISEKVNRLYSASVDDDSEITITPGATYAIFTALCAILHKGDEVIVFEPAYDSYVPGILINGAVPVRISLNYPEYKIDWQEVKSKINPRTKAVIINSPHNPSGTLLTEGDIQQLRDVIRDTQIIIISDEVYEHLVFDGKAHLSVLKYPDLRSRSFACFSFGKVFHCTGWKCGYIISPPELMSEFRKIHQFNCFTTNGPMQYALESFLADEDTYIQTGFMIQQKRDYFAERMKTTRFKPLPSFGSYFQLYSYNDISDESENVFARKLVEDFGVATIPVSAFYSGKKDDKVLRFCFAKKESTLEEAVKRLRNV